LEFWVVLVGFILASMTATLTPIPIGLGTVEAGSVVILSLLDLPIEAALAAFLLRGFSFRLPMLPGLWLVKREISGL
jgi:glycosyltransferase 2 family protein